MTESQLTSYVGQIVTVSLRDGTTVTGRLHDKNSTLDLSSPYAIEYASPQNDTAYTDHRFHAISSTSEIVALQPSPA